MRCVLYELLKVSRPASMAELRRLDVVAGTSALLLVLPHYNENLILLIVMQVSN